MQQLEERHYRFVILFSVILSPMVYLDYGVIDAMLPGPLIGFVFLFGSLDWYPTLNIRNPMNTRHFLPFSYLALLWFLIGIYLVFSFPQKMGKWITPFGHLAAFALQASMPYILFSNTLVVIPLPITPIVSLLVLWFYIRNHKQDTVNG